MKLPSTKRSRRKSKEKMKKKEKWVNHIQSELKKRNGKVKLYVHPDCTYCRKQLSSIWILDSEKDKDWNSKVVEYRNIIDCDKTGNCESIEGFPTWNINGKNYEGKMSKKKLHELLKKKVTTRSTKKSNRKFGGSELYQQPQPDGYTRGTQYTPSCTNNPHNMPELFQSRIPNHFGKSRRRYGGNLPRPYGPRDQGIIKFGSTPGTPEYNYQGTPYTTDPIVLGTPNNFPNVPMQYNNNAKNKFGKMTTLDAMQGPNVVGYERPIDVYNGAGSNTTNWMTGTTYLPEAPSLTGIQTTPENPLGYLSGRGLSNTTDLGPARNTIKQGLGFGGLVYNPQPIQGDAQVIYQPAPPYLTKKPNRFGKTITLQTNGRVSVS